MRVVRGGSVGKVNPERVRVWSSSSGRVRRADWPHGPKFYAYAGRAYVGAYDSLERAIAAVESAKIRETPTTRRERIVSRAVHVLTVGLSPEVRRMLLDDEDDPIPEFFARFGVVPYASELAAIYATSKKTIQNAEHAGAAKVRSSEMARDAHENAMSRGPTWWEIIGGMADA